MQRTVWILIGVFCLVACVTFMGIGVYLLTLNPPPPIDEVQAALLDRKFIRARDGTVRVLEPWRPQLLGEDSCSKIWVDLKAPTIDNAPRAINGDWSITSASVTLMEGERTLTGVVTDPKVRAPNEPEIYWGDKISSIGDVREIDLPSSISADVIGICQPAAGGARRHRKLVGKATVALTFPKKFGDGFINSREELTANLDLVVVSEAEGQLILANKTFQDRGIWPLFFAFGICWGAASFVCLAGGGRWRWLIAR